MGPKATATLIRHGFYPAGGGCFEVTIEPSSRLTGFDLLERGSVRSQNVRAMVSNLPEHIAAREVQTVLNQMGWETHCGRREAVDARGPGNVLLVEVVSDHVTEVFTAFGRRGVPAEAVAEEVVREIRDYLRTDAPVGPHLADQLILPFGISVWQADPPHRQRRGAFRTLPLTPHADTHIELVRQFLEIEIHVERSADGATRIVRIGG